MVRFAIVGATGLVGQEVLRILEERSVCLDSIQLLASKESVGKSIRFRGEDLLVQEAIPGSFEGIDFAIFSAGTEVSKQLIPEAVQRGTVVIDNSNAFRMETNVPLVVPEVNLHALAGHSGIIANPNCSTAQMIVALKPLHDYTRIRRIWVSTYQSVSGTGIKAVEELKVQALQRLQGEPVTPEVYQKPIAFNLIPQIDIFLENGFTQEEMKLVRETRKILEDEEILVEATAVRVPVLIGHSEAVTIETEEAITPEIARELLREAHGVRVMDTVDEELYPTPLDVAGGDDVLVGRIRQSLFGPNFLSMWIVGDNLRKGAALNAVQILEHLIAERS